VLLLAALLLLSLASCAELLATQSELAQTPADRREPHGLHLALGSPSGAAPSPTSPQDYLIVRPQYALSYSRDRGIPNWVSWHLQQSDLGPVERFRGPFITDTSLPGGWPRVAHGDYTGSGYDRGHMVPSADRTASDADNQATFIMTNVMPQAPAVNRGAWERLESHARDLVAQGNELYIVAGGYGSQGELADGALTIPSALWKIIVALPEAGGDDAARVTADTTVIAVWMPNTDDLEGSPWEDSATTVRCIEERTGLTFLGAVDPAAKAALAGEGCAAGAGGVAAAPATAPQVTIAEIVYAPRRKATDEYVVIRNGGGSPVELTGWTLRDRAGNSYTFPRFTLGGGGEVRIWTKVGEDDRGNLYWDQRQGVWNNSGGDAALLHDAAGNEVARYEYE
jgi:endonuclease G